MNQQQHRTRSTAQSDDPQPGEGAGRLGSASEKKRTMLIAGVAAAAVVVAGIAIAFMTMGGDDATPGSSGSTLDSGAPAPEAAAPAPEAAAPAPEAAAPAPEAAAPAPDAATRTPTETVTAAFESATSNSLHLAMGESGSPTEARVDYVNHVAVITSDSDEYGRANGVIRDGLVYMRLEKGAEERGMKPDRWYRSSATTGPFAPTTVVLDPNYLKKYVTSATEIVEAGPVTVDGIDAMRYKLVQDKNKLAEIEVQRAPESLREVGRTGLHDQLVASLPDSIEVTIDKAGRLIQLDKGAEGVSRISDIGQPVEVPAIDESEVEDLPAHP